MTRARALGLAAVLAILLLGAALALVVLDDVRAQRDAARQVGDLRGQLAAAHGLQDQLDAQLSALRSQNSDLQTEARNPTLEMWNRCAGACTIAPNTVLAGSVPDTFQLLLTFTADVPVRSYIFSLDQWTQFDNCGFAASCVRGAYQTFAATTSQNTTFSEATGCAAYVWVLQADRSGTITPDVRVHYQPASQPTGTCATG